MLFYQQDIIDWLRRIICFDARVPKISARSLRSLAVIYMYGFSRVSGFLVGINRHEREDITSVTNTKDIYQQNNNKNRMFQTQKYKIFFSLAIIDFLEFLLLLYRQKYAIYQHNNEKNRMFPTRKYENFGSLAIIYGFFLSFWFSSRYNSPRTKYWEE